MIVYEVDLRSIRTGDSVFTIYSGYDDDKAFGIAERWNKYPHLFFTADVIICESEYEVHGIGRFKYN